MCEHAKRSWSHWPKYSSNDLLSPARYIMWDLKLPDIIKRCICTHLNQSLQVVWENSVRTASNHWCSVKRLTYFSTNGLMSWATQLDQNMTSVIVHKHFPFCLWTNDDCGCMWRLPRERHLLANIVERHVAVTPDIIVWEKYHFRTAESFCAHCRSFYCGTIISPSCLVFTLDTGSWHRRLLAHFPAKQFQYTRLTANSQLRGRIPLALLVVSLKQSLSNGTFVGPHRAPVAPNINETQLA